MTILGQSDGIINVQPNPFPPGVVNILHRDLHFVDARWILATTYSLQPLQEVIDTLSESYFRVMKTGKKAEIPAMNATSTNVKIALAQIKAEFGELLSMVNDDNAVTVESPRKRVKRGLLDDLYHLFGIATTEDKEEVQDQIRQAENEQKHFLTRMHRQTTVMRNLLGEVRSQQSHLVHLVNLTLGMEKAVESLAKAGKHGHSLQYNTLQQIMQSIAVVEEHLGNLYEIMHVLNKNELPPKLISRTELMMGMEEIQQSVQPNLSLAFNTDEVNFYYENPICTRVPTNNSIHVLVAVPLIKSNTLYQLHELIPFPSGIGNITRKAENGQTDASSKIMWNKAQPRWVALKKDFNGIRFMDNDEFKNCYPGKRYVCPQDSAEYSRKTNHCEWGLLGLDIAKLAFCSYQTVSSPLPIAYPITSQLWVVSIAKSSMGNVTCNQTFISLNMTADALIHLDEGCEMVTDELKIHSTSSVKGKDSSQGDPIKTFTWTKFNSPQDNQMIIEALKGTQINLEHELVSLNVSHNQWNQDVDLLNMNDEDVSTFPPLDHPMIWAPWILILILSMLIAIWITKRLGQRCSTQQRPQFFGIPLTYQVRRQEVVDLPDINI